MNKMNQQHWAVKVAEARQTISITLDKAEQFFRQRLAEEQKAFIDEATKIATDIIKKKLEEMPEKITSNGELLVETEEDKAEQPAEKPQKRKIEMTEDNIRILQQVKEVQKKSSDEKREALAKKLELEKERIKKEEEGKRIVEKRIRGVGEREWTGQQI